MSEKRRVDGKTFDERVQELEQVTTPEKAREIAAIEFGMSGDVVILNEDGTPVNPLDDERGL
jgi:hypothetical protein